jgi:hypothetical protein
MPLDTVKNLFITLCFSIILFASGSSIYLVKSNYYKTTGLVEESKCIHIPKTNLYSCDLTISYSVAEDLVTNQLVINSDKPYKVGDKIDIEYDSGNYLNISTGTEYKQSGLLLSVSGLIFLIITIIIYNEIKKDISELLNFIPNFT